jgi:hypothetical protein
MKTVHKLLIFRGPGNKPIEPTVDQA